jgi:hypothetical protein
LPSSSPARASSHDAWRTTAAIVFSSRDCRNDLTAYSGVPKPSAVPAIVSPISGRKAPFLTDRGRTCRFPWLTRWLQPCIIHFSGPFRKLSRLREARIPAGERQRKKSSPRCCSGLASSSLLLGIQIRFRDEICFWTGCRRLRRIIVTQHSASSDSVAGSGTVFD